MDDRVARLGAAEDVARIATLLDAFQREFEEPSPGVEFIVRRLTELLAEPSTFVIVAGNPICSLAVVVARTSVWSEGPVVLLEELYTVPESRSDGWGSVVLKEAMAESRRRGAESMEIGVDEPDVDALRFYARHGFPLRNPETGDLAYFLIQNL